jgi:hypothetical protein
MCSTPIDLVFYYLCRDQICVILMALDNNDLEVLIVTWVTMTHGVYHA